MSLSPETISGLKQIINCQISQLDIQGLVNESLSEVQNGAVDKDALLQRLKSKVFIQDIMSQPKFGEETQNKHTVKNAHKDDGLMAMNLKNVNIDPSRQYLHFQILSGRAFLDHLHTDEQAHSPESASTFTVHLHWRGQRFKSRPAACACDPEIRESFLLQLNKDQTGNASRVLDPASLLSLCDPIHIVLIRTDATGDTTLVSSQFHEWRTVLSTQDGRQRSSIELFGTGKECKVPVGLLEVQLMLLPPPTSSLTDGVVAAQLTTDRNWQAERERLFLVYARNWWREFSEIRAGHSERMVKIFAQDENLTSRPVCSFVRPLRCGRLLDTPRHAARFVSLVGQEKVAVIGGGERSEQWATAHACLCRNKGDVEDHAVLLCSILLGFGMEAYVCVGTKTRGVVVAWVATVSTDHVVTFWDALQAHRYIHVSIDPNDPPLAKQHRAKHLYKTIGCVFNHSSFYANCQPSDAVDVCRFDLENGSLWKQMSRDAIQSVCGVGMSPLWPTFPPLCANSLDSSIISNDLEHQLRTLVSSHRADNDLTTVWDDHLSYLLSPSLYAYELERVTGISAGNEEFQDTIRRCVPEGETFKGYPICMSHRNPRRVLTSCLRASVCEEIINCRGDHVRLAVRVRVFTYPESAISTWVMFACKYKSVL